MAEYMDSNYNIEEIYIELKKLFVLRKSYLENPIKENQDKIVEIVNLLLPELDGIANAIVSPFLKPLKTLERIGNGNASPFVKVLSPISRKVQ